MDSEKVRQTPRASQYRDMTIETEELHPDYEIEVEPNSATAETGRLTTFKVIPKTGAGPRFEGRWDNKPETVDIDMFGSTAEEERKFKAQKEGSGYSGHHSERASDPAVGRSYKIHIALPSLGTIFRGVVNFKVDRVIPCGAGKFKLS